MDNDEGWTIRAYFAGDLFHFLWSIGEGQYCSRVYPQIKSQWRSQLGEGVAGEVDRIVDWKTASLSQSILGTLFHYSDAESVRDVITCVEDPEPMKQSIQGAEIFDVDRRCLMGWLSYNIAKNRKRLLTVLSSLEHLGYDSYWNGKIEPVVEERAREIQKQLSQYGPQEIAHNVQDLLGSAYCISSEPKPIYLTYFSYALVYHLPDDSSVHSFRSGRPVDIQLFASTLTHELLHNFVPGEELRAYYDELSSSTLFSKTREVLYGWGEPDTEDLIVAAEKYLMTEMGIVSSEQAFHHLYTNYGGAQMLAAIIYDYMDNGELGGETYERFLIELFESGGIRAQTVDKQYCATLERRVGDEEMVSTLGKIERNYEKYVR